MKLTAIVTCKNRDNIQLCVESMRVCYPRPHCIVVDFGSTVPVVFPGCSSWLRVIRVERNTEMFHKARAINIGIRSVTTPYLCIVDADQIFSPNFFGVVLSTLQRIPNSFVMCKTYSLLRYPDIASFDHKGALFSTLLQEAKHSGVPLHGDGCCNGVSTKWAMLVHGYDETYVGYRAQDSDFALRALFGGLKKTWIEGLANMIHLPHSRTGDYYSDQYKVTNKRKYKKKTKMLAKKILVANTKIDWGRL